MDPNRKLWNQQQQELRSALRRPADHSRAVELFLRQHAMVHSSQMAPTGLVSFDDELWQGLESEAARRSLQGEEHSIVWMLWHIARIEDVTMNLLAAGSPQVVNQNQWLDRMQVIVCDTANAMDEGEVAKLSTAIDVEALRAYRNAVGRRTREIVQQLTPEAMKRKVEPARLQRVMDEGAVAEAARWLLDYWGGLTIAGLLLMPPTRHNLVHLNEAGRVKRKG